MAGNLMKNWWKKCKIRPNLFIGSNRYKKVLDCQTDSEDLIYSQGRTSSCSAPPDLLIVADKSNDLPLENETLFSNDNTPSQIKDNEIKNSTNISKNNDEKEKDCHNSKPLEEFLCDVSVESSVSSSPLQFSFTFYDLDGHHGGKITKDDIAGIVYTIYESLGKSVTVPCNGSKTINVRLTVSPENNTVKKKQTIMKYSMQNNGRKSNIKCSSRVVEDKNTMKAKKNNTEGTPEFTPKRESKSRQTSRKPRRIRKNESRQRSLSVGNEGAWKLNSKNGCQMNCRNANNKNTQYDICKIGGSAGDLENTQHALSCKNNGLKRNELIDIIRESMEKNRLCFQTNGKQISSRFRRAENLAAPSNFLDTNNKKNLQPHIPIYQQQLAINPAIFSTNVNSDRNLCGYDSVLHAQICNGNNKGSVSPENGNGFSPFLNFHRKLPHPNFKEYLDLKAKKNVKNNLLYAKLAEKSKNETNLNKCPIDNRDSDNKKNEFNIEMENLISESSDENLDQSPTKPDSFNDNSSFSSSTIHRYVHEHIHHHYHHFENKNQED